MGPLSAAPGGEAFRDPWGTGCCLLDKAPLAPAQRAAALSHQTPRHQVSGAWSRRDHFSQAVKTLEGHGPRNRVLARSLDHPVVR